MSRNSKNARNMVAARALPKNRSAAARARKAAGEARKPGRATSPNHGKKNAWWQLKLTYAEFIKGGGKKRKSRKAEGADVSDLEINADVAAATDSQLA